MGFATNVAITAFLVLFSISEAQCAKPGCPDACGSVKIPYPFGIGPGCSFDPSFSVKCIQNKPFVYDAHIPVLDISVDGYLRVSLNSSQTCYHDRNKTDEKAIAYEFPSNIAVSSTRNMLTAVGCGIYTQFTQFSGSDFTSCVTDCSSLGQVDIGTCAGQGCCQTPILTDTGRFNLSVSYLNSSSLSSERRTCSYAFLVEEAGYSFNLSDIGSSRSSLEHPVVLDWWIGQDNCQTVDANTKTHQCHDNTCVVSQRSRGRGHSCRCSEGYAGNPYLPNGCLDIDECKQINDCINPETCHNTEGNYTCGCPKGRRGDGRKMGTGCVKKSPIWKDVVMGIAIALLVLLLLLFGGHVVSTRKKLERFGKQIFEQNGGVLLLQKLDLQRSKQEARIFSSKEIEKATKNYNESMILGRGGQGTVYKGILSDNRTVGIKKAKIGDLGRIDHFVNEIILLSQIDHRNIVKLLGCCLETEVPSLIYEFVTNGSLFDHIHHTGNRFTVSWKARLRIASETAGALWFLHSAAPTPIIHRDIKSANILLDDNFRAKVSDFGTSRMIPADKEQLTTLVQGYTRILRSGIFSNKPSK